MNAWVLAAALLAQLEPSGPVTVRSVPESRVSSYFISDAYSYLTIQTADIWVPLTTNAGPTILHVNQRCGCLAMVIAGRMAYIPCDAHAGAVRLALPKDAPTLPKGAPTK